MPYSESYVALGLGGCGVAWTGKTYVVPSVGTTVELPGFTDTSRGEDGRGDGQWGQTCPDCREARALSGACSCD